MERKYAKINSDYGGDGESSSKHDYPTNKSTGS